MKAFLREILGTLILAIIVFFLLRVTVQSSVVLYSSMEPTLQEGQWILVNKVTYHFRQPQRGDVIIFPNPNNPDENYIKRIIGLPGETLEMKEGMVYIQKEDGTFLTLDEPYIQQISDPSFEGDIIPEDEYFVLGDNRNNSIDSRQGWTVERKSVMGKAWLSIWPPSKWGLVSNYSLPE